MHFGPLEIRPHRFGGEGVLIGAQTATLNAVAISALAGGGGAKTISHRDLAPKTISHRDLVLVVFASFFDDFWVSELNRVLKCNFGSFW